MADLATRRAGSLAALASSGATLVAGTTLEEPPPAARFVLRASDGAAARLSDAFGTLPAALNSAATEGSRAGLKIGPDEWLLLAPGTEAAPLLAALEAALGQEPHSLVDVSHRQTGILVSGPGAALVLAGANPLDLDLVAFPVGMATRTILDKAEIVLWRQAEDRFHVEVWRSFAPYAWQLLEVLRAENA
jgi:sarcosine oxidase, subunit gamma